MFKNRLELVKNMTQIMRITLILMCKPSTSSIHFKFGFDFFNILYVWGFVLFSGFFSRWILGFFFITEWQHWSYLHENMFT